MALRGGLLLEPETEKVDSDIGAIHCDTAELHLITHLITGRRCRGNVHYRAPLFLHRACPQCWISPN